MINIKDKSKCCGCSACFNICPKNAIIMKEDEYGFKYPIVDKEKCINCGLCERVCPILNNKKEENKIEAYACYNKNIDERLNSSSGGIFALLAKEIIKRNGIVFGAAFDKKFDVKHIFIDNEKDLEKLMGSKYVQSDICNTYKKVKEFLEKGKYVLFSGTPCQIEGLKKYLQKDYDNLYTQDIICHGVPSPKIWQMYLEYRKNLLNDDIKNIFFRNKEKSWSLYKLKILFNKHKYNKIFIDDPYMKLFLQNITLRDSCYDCSFKKKYRESDITLADYWGINKIHKNMNDDKGVSLLVVNSKKGQELFDCINENIIYEKTNIDDAIKYNPSMIESPLKNKNRDTIMNEINELNFDKVVNKYIPKEKILKRIFVKFKRIIKKIIRRS